MQSSEVDDKDRSEIPQREASAEPALLSADGEGKEVLSESISQAACVMTQEVSESAQFISQTANAFPASFNETLAHAQREAQQGQRTHALSISQPLPQAYLTDTVGSQSRSKFTQGLSSFPHPQQVYEHNL